MIASIRRLLRAPFDQAALIRAHRALVDEALRAHRAGASLPEVQRISVGAHRTALPAGDSAVDSATSEEARR